MAGHVYPFAATRGSRYVGAIVFALFLSGGGGGQAWGPMTDTNKTDLACNGYGFYPDSQQYDDGLLSRGAPNAPIGLQSISRGRTKEIQRIRSTH
jgi:hypothetical protein